MITSAPITIAAAAGGTYLDEIHVTIASTYADSYNVYRSTASGTLGPLLGNIPPGNGNTVYIDSTAAATTIYWYTAEGVIGLDVTALSNQASASITPTAINGITQVGAGGPFATKVIMLPDQITTNSGVDGLLMFSGLKGNRPRTLIAIGDVIYPSQKPLVHHNVIPYETDSVLQFDGYTFFGDQSTNFPYTSDTGLPGNYIRGYAAGVFKLSADLTNLATLADADVMAGAIWTSDGATSVGKIIINGVVKQLVNYPDVAKSISIWFDTTFSDLPSYLGEYAGYVYGLDLSYDTGSISSYTAWGPQNDQGAYIPFSLFLNDTFTGSAGLLSAHTGEDTGTWTFESVGAGIDSDWGIDGNGFFIPTSDGYNSSIYHTTKIPQPTLNSWNTTKPDFYLQLDFSLLGLEAPALTSFERMGLGLFAWDNTTNKYGVSARIYTQWNYPQTFMVDAWDQGAYVGGGYVGESTTVEMTPYTDYVLILETYNNRLGWRVKLNDVVIANSGPLTNAITLPIITGMHVESEFTTGISDHNWKVNRIIGGYVHEILAFDNKDVKSAWYVDQVTGDTPGNFMPGYEHYGSPLAMYTNPYTRVIDGASIQPYTWNLLPNVNVEGVAPLNYYDRAAPVQLNVNLGGYAPSWTSHAADGGSTWSMPFYDLGYPGSTAYTSTQYFLDGGVYYPANSWYGMSGQIDLWRYSSSFELLDPQVITSYTITDQTNSAPVIHAGLRIYPGVASTSSNWDGSHYIQALNFGYPVLFEMWYSKITAAPPAPVASFTSDAATVDHNLPPVTVTFTDTSTNSPDVWLWAFGDGDTSTEQNPAHTYLTHGHFSVTLTASNWFGAGVYTATRHVYVTGATISDFTGSVVIGTDPLTVNFTDTTVLDPTSWSWDFGDAGTSSLQNPSHIFSGVGVYTVALTTSNAYGGDTMTKTSYITVNPVAPVITDFVADTLTGDTPLLVNFSFTYSGGAPTSIAWDYDNNGSVDSISATPAKTFLYPGTYNVRLTISNISGTSTLLKTAYLVIGGLPPAAYVHDTFTGTGPLLSHSGEAGSTTWTDSYADPAAANLYLQADGTVRCMAGLGGYSDYLNVNGTIPSTGGFVVEVGFILDNNSMPGAEGFAFGPWVFDDVNTSTVWIEPDFDSNTQSTWKVYPYYSIGTEGANGVIFFGDMTAGAHVHSFMVNDTRTQLVMMFDGVIYANYAVTAGLLDKTLGVGIYLSLSEPATGVSGAGLNYILAKPLDGSEVFPTLSVVLYDTFSDGPTTL